MKILKRYGFLLVLLFLFGCSEHYVPIDTVLPQYIKKIAVVKFKDTTNHPEFQEKLEYTLKDKFVTDRRVELVEETKADAILVGTITRYILEPLEYDANFTVTKHSLWVWVDISLLDVVTNKILWTEKRLEARVEYSRKTQDLFAPTTEIEAQDIEASQLSDLIVKRTIDGWFAASGVSQRK